MAFAAIWPAILNNKILLLRADQYAVFFYAENTSCSTTQTRKRGGKQRNKQRTAQNSSLSVAEDLEQIKFMVRIPRFYGIYGLVSLLFIILTALSIKGKRCCLHFSNEKLIT